MEVFESRLAEFAAAGKLTHKEVTKQDFHSYIGVLLAFENPEKALQLASLVKFPVTVLPLLIDVLK